MLKLSAIRLFNPKLLNVQLISSLRPGFITRKPQASEILTAYIQQTKEPPWTSFFIKVR